MQNNIATLENSSAVSHEINIYLPHDPAIPPLDICPEEMKTSVHIKTCTRTFIASYSQMQKTGNNQKSFNWWIAKSKTKQNKNSGAFIQENITQQ